MDLKALATEVPVAMRKRISTLVRGNMDPPEDGKGPLKTMVQVLEFDSVHLLADIHLDIAEDLLKRINTDFSKREPGYEHKIVSINTKYFVRTHT